MKAFVYAASVTDPLASGKGSPRLQPVGGGAAAEPKKHKGKSATTDPKKLRTSENQNRAERTLQILVDDRLEEWDAEYGPKTKWKLKVAESSLGPSAGNGLFIENLAKSPITVTPDDLVFPYWGIVSIRNTDPPPGSHVIEYDSYSSSPKVYADGEFNKIRPLTEEEELYIEQLKNTRKGQEKEEDKKKITNTIAKYKKEKLKLRKENGQQLLKNTKLPYNFPALMNTRFDHKHRSIDEPNNMKTEKMEIGSGDHNYVACMLKNNLELEAGESKELYLQYDEGRGYENAFKIVYKRPCFKERDCTVENGRKSKVLGANAEFTAPEFNVDKDELVRDIAQSQYVRVTLPDLENPGKSIYVVGQLNSPAKDKFKNAKKCVKIKYKQPSSRRKKAFFSIDCVPMQYIAWLAPCNLAAEEYETGLLNEAYRAHFFSRQSSVQCTEQTETGTTTFAGIIASGMIIEAGSDGRQAAYVMVKKNGTTDNFKCKLQNVTKTKSATSTKRHRKRASPNGSPASLPSLSSVGIPPPPRYDQ